MEPQQHTPATPEKALQLPQVEKTPRSVSPSTPPPPRLTATTVQGSPVATPLNLSMLGRYFALAVQFLTVVRVRVADPVTEEDQRNAAWFFPVVGLVLGLALAVTGWLLRCLLPWPVVAALLVVELVVLTGALHLDGLADTCDGFYAGRERDDVLRIMKDPHIGTMGVVGLICVLGLKAVALMNVPKEQCLWVAAAAPVDGVGAQVNACLVGHGGREEGTGST